MKRPYLLGLAALAGIALALVGCSSSTTPGGKTDGPAGSKAALKIGYSDWPGWLVWEIGIQKGFFKDAGVDVTFEWADYLETIVAFDANRTDAVNIVCGDSLTAARSSTAILLTDYSNGNDMIIGKEGINSIKDLKGKKIGLELGLVEHILLDKALKDNGMTEEDVKLEDTKTDSTAQVLAGGSVDAIAAWYPISRKALDTAAKSKALYTSAQAPGLLYDALQVGTESLVLRKDDWKKVIGVWFRCLDYLEDPKTHDEAVEIMAKRITVKAEELGKNLKGTKLLDKEGNLKALQKRDTLDSVYGSLKNANDFYVKHVKDYKSKDIEKYVDSSLLKEVVEKK